MNFICTNATDMSGVLTKGHVYKGEYAKHIDIITIYRCDDGKKGYFEGWRFEEVMEFDNIEPKPYVYNYTIRTEKK